MISNSSRREKIDKIKRILGQTDYLSIYAVSSLIQDHSPKRLSSRNMMRQVAKEEPEKYIFVPAFSTPIKMASRIYNREALIEDTSVLLLFERALKNRCYGGRI